MRSGCEKYERINHERTKIVNVMVAELETAELMEFTENHFKITLSVLTKWAIFTSLLLTVLDGNRKLSKSLSEIYCSTRIN